MNNGKFHWHKNSINIFNRQYQDQWTSEQANRSRTLWQMAPWATWNVKPFPNRKSKRGQQWFYLCCLITFDKRKFMIDQWRANVFDTMYKWKFKMYYLVRQTTVEKLPSGSKLPSNHPSSANTGLLICSIDPKPAKHPRKPWEILKTKYHIRNQNRSTDTHQRSLTAGPSWVC